jgi:hypothetical protein
MAFAVACASSSTPPAAPAAAAPATPPPSTTSPVAAPSAVRPASSASGPVAPATSAVAGAPAPEDPSAVAAADCRIVPELELAYEKLGQGQPKKQWIMDAGAKLLEPETAERVLTGISQEIVSAIAHRKYGKLGALASKEGVCMRAARDAPCQVLSDRALAGCEWRSSSTDDAPPRYSCGEAFRRIFYSRDFLHLGKPHFNCFAGAGGGAQRAPIIASGPRLGYVELRSEEADGVHSLWFVFDGDPRAPELVEIISDNSGGRSSPTP